MANFSLVIVPAKVMAGGKHKVRVMVSHNGQTRYILTDIIIDSEAEFKNGKVVKRPDKDIMNLRLKKICDKYFDRYMELEFSNCLTCSQLVKLITDDGRDKCRTFEEVVDEYLSQIDIEDRGKTYKLYRLAANRFIQFAGTGAPLEHITPIRINNYINSLKKQRLSNTTVNIYITLLKVILNYAQKMQHVNFKIDPFITAKVPSAKKRDTFITVEQLKKVRDYEAKKHNMMVVHDIFMLTYYLAGMNLVDMLDYNFKNADEINYIRRKTRNTKDGDSMVCFTIPDEAKPLIAKYMDKKTGKLVFGKYKTYVSCYNTLTRKMKDLAIEVGIRHDFTLYSARKSFVQHGFDLGVPLSTLEYCIGQSMKEDRPIFNYVSIMKVHADKAIRIILDNLK